MTIQKVSNQEVVISGTWNSASAYNGVIIDIRDLSSNINSDLLDLRLNGVTKANITKGGMINTTSSVSALGTIYAASLSSTTYLNLPASSTVGGSNTQVQFNNNGVFSGNPRFTYVYDPATQSQYLYLSSCFPNAPFGGANDLYSTVSANRFTGRYLNSPDNSAYLNFNSNGLITLAPGVANQIVSIVGSLTTNGNAIFAGQVDTAAITNSTVNENNIDLVGGTHAISITPDATVGTGRVKVEGDFEATNYYGLPSTALSSLSDVSSPLNPSTGKALIYSGTKWIASSVGASPGGSNTQVQFNNSGSFSGVSNFTYDNSTSTLTVTNVSATTYNNLGNAFYGSIYAVVNGYISM